MVYKSNGFHYSDFMESENLELVKKEILTLSHIHSRVNTGNEVYENRIESFLKYCKERKIDPDLSAVRLYMKEESLSSSTKKLTKTAIKSKLTLFYENYPELLREIERNFKGIKTGKKQTIGINPQDCYDPREIDLIIERLNSKPISKKYNTDPLRYKKISLILWTLFNTGMRISELIGIKMVNIHLNGIAKIKITGKGDKEREIFLPREKVNEIMEVFSSREYLFESSGKNKKYDRVNLSKLLKREIESVYPEKHFHPHLLRHSFGTYQIISKKKSVKAISNYLGHSSTAITQDLYVHDNLKYEDLFD